VSSYFVLRSAAAQWPPPLQPRLPILVTGLNTLVLLGSSVALVRALRARTDRALVVRGLAVAAALGVVFLTVQGYEWIRLVGYGLTLGSGVYGATFYTLIGVHGAHVLAALGWLTVTLVLLARGGFPEGRMATVRACALYWHFVVMLWPILYVSVYLS
jgi:heme/copper-type cytochrome/quinol oxidase subunit 3